MTSRRQSKQVASSKTPDFPQLSEYDSRIQKLLNSLPAQVNNIHKQRDEYMKGGCDVETLQSKLESEQKASAISAYEQQLVPLYKKRKEEVSSHCETIRKALETITEIKSLQQQQRIARRVGGQNDSDEQTRKNVRRGVLMCILSKDARTLPLWIGRPGEVAPPLCGAIPATAEYVSSPGDKVAARVKTSQSEEDQWILAEVISFHTGTQRYSVDDIDEEGRESHVLSKRRVVPLPMWKANPDTDVNALFEIGTVVMALYPQTTCFYRAKIDGLPVDSSDHYSVLFEDNSYSTGYSPVFGVEQKHIVITREMRESKKK